MVPSRDGLVVCLIAMFASLTLTLADLEVPSITNKETNNTYNSWNPRNWTQTMDRNYYVIPEKSCTTQISEVLREKSDLQERLLGTIQNMSESLQAKEKELCALRSNLTHLDSKNGFNEGVKTELKELKLEHSREIARLRTEKQNLDDDISRLRKIRRNDMNNEIQEIDDLKNKSLLMHEENMKLEFQSKKLNQTIWSLELALEDCDRINLKFNDCKSVRLNLTDINEQLIMENSKLKNHIKNITDEHKIKFQELEEVLKGKNQEISELNTTRMQEITEIKQDKENLTSNLQITILQLKTIETTLNQRERDMNITKQELQQQLSQLKKQLQNLTDENQLLPNNHIKNSSDLNMVEINGKSYFVGEMNIKKTWNETRQFCNSYGLKLCSIESLAENNALGAYFGQRFDTDWNHFWLGASDEASEGEWIWVETGKQLVYKNWNSESFTGKRKENCMVTCRSGRSGLQWHDEPCGNKHHVLCELN